MPTIVRISKLLSERGICSRREADDFIIKGWVLVDGKPVTELGTKIHPHQELALHPSAKRRQGNNLTVLVNKPIGYVSHGTDEGYPLANDLITHSRLFQVKTKPQKIIHHQNTKRLSPAGRLDIDSTGLLVLTQDGRIAKQLINESSIIEKEYLVRVEGYLSDHGLSLLNHGLCLDGKALKPAKVVWQNTDQLKFILVEGKKRQIRRMCELVGLHVIGLKRIRIGSVMLGKLPLGYWRYLGEEEKF